MLSTAMVSTAMLSAPPMLRGQVKRTASRRNRSSGARSATGQSLAMASPVRGSYGSRATPSGCRQSPALRPARAIIRPHTGAAMAPPVARGTIGAGRSKPIQTTPTSSGV